MSKDNNQRRPPDDPFEMLFQGFSELVENLSQLGDASPEEWEKSFRNQANRTNFTYNSNNQNNRHSSSEPSSDSPPQDNTKYDQAIGGLGERMERILELVELPLRKPELFERLGISPPTGVLLHGPPGCGKTLIARTLAKIAGVRFFSISGPEIINKYYGESEARLRKLFDQAQREAPAILFIDEIDALAPKRDQSFGDLEKRVVAQLLTLMDGLDDRGQVIVIGATNRPNALDPALRRPGRFDREIEIPVPDQQGRREILEIHTQPMPLTKGVDLDDMARRTHGFVGADLASLCREAALQALRRVLKKTPVTQLDSGSIKVGLPDFAAAFREVEPSALRETVISVPNVKWEEVGGLSTVKSRLIEAVEWPLRYGHLFAQAGLRPSRGILLVGPPGCGKTLLAKALATESQANFVAMKGADLHSKYVGESEQRLRDIFRRARQAAPCILFFDELDAFLPARGMMGLDAAVSERILAQFLVEMDGIEELKGVLVLGATNRVDRLDEAILRPGRFDEIVKFAPPDAMEREEILKIHLKQKPLSDEVDANYLAGLTEGWSGAELSAACNRAALLAVQRAVHGELKRMSPITREDLLQALRQIRPEN
ncbi:MAG TPA: AAA family ATPase [Deltaproteobacteria bacterium]|nr:AAA family ATPase [Deltaproteobacteria bacterium]|tara:strand:+ start:617 stop:2425 length:1809 start_codon:yes stop_codon:yes gene_type:complete